jgi:hypothetical protein
MLVKEVKAMLHAATGLRDHEYFLLFAAKPLREDRLLKDYGIVLNKSTIHLCVKQQGGCFIFSLTILTILTLSALAAPCTCGVSLMCALPLAPLLCFLPFCCL